MAPRRHNSTGTRRRRRPNRLTGTWEEIRRCQNSTDLFIRKAPFKRLVREITNRLSREAQDMRYQIEALEALQEASEKYLVDTFELAQSCALNARRVTIQPKDITLVRCLRNEDAVLD